MKNVVRILLNVALIALISGNAFARDIEYKDEEITVQVNPGEPTQIKFPGTISGGFKKKDSTLSLDRKDSDLVIFAQQSLNDTGEVIIVRLNDGRSYSIRVARASDNVSRDDIVKIEDSRAAIVTSSEEEPAYKEKNFEYAPATQVSGLMREMVLAAEFGKNAIPGYKSSEAHAGEAVLNDGALDAKIERIFTGTNLWGYVLSVENKLGESQKINPAAFRLDGTRAISASSWELAPKPISGEQKMAGAHQGKIYIVTRAR